MSSLWTPGGERPVPPREPAPAASPTPTSGPPPGAPSFDDLSPEEQARAEQMAAEMAQAQARILETPASIVIANHTMGLYELAAIHLSADPPNLEEARAAIDAMSAIVDALEGRLGDHEATLRDARSQLQMAFVQVSGALDAAPPESDA